jgi:dephospho-CoA kinase
MVVLGLTGSIGMGKTTAANTFRTLKISVFDADNTVHNLMMPGGAAVDEILEVFPEVAMDGGVDRQALGTIVFSDKRKLKKLEDVLHPFVRIKQNFFLSTTARKRERLVVLDTPLLLETGGERYCDGVVVVSAPTKIQKYRVLQRPGMTIERFQLITDRQIENNQKCRIADFVVQTGLGRLHSLRKITKIIKLTKFWRPRRRYISYNR